MLVLTAKRKTDTKSRISNNKKYQPFIKWVGGKRGLLSQILDKFPTRFESYHEPFLGGGAVFFELYSRGLLKDKKIFLSDINTELINTYSMVKNSPDELINQLDNYKERHTAEFYYKTRQIDRMADFLELIYIHRRAPMEMLDKIFQKITKNNVKLRLV